MTRSRRSIYLTLGSFVVLVLTLTVTTCGGDKFQTPAQPSLTHATAANTGMVTGYGTCQFSINNTPITAGPDGIDGELHLTVIPGANPILPVVLAPEGPIPVDALDPCPWTLIAPGWVLLKSPTQTDKGPVFYNSRRRIHGSGSATIRYHVLHGSLDANDFYSSSPTTWEYPQYGDFPLDERPLACEARTYFDNIGTDRPYEVGYQPSDYTMNPEIVDFDYAGGTGPTITIDVIPPKTREGYFKFWATTTDPATMQLSRWCMAPTGENSGACSGGGGWTYGPKNSQLQAQPFDETELFNIPVTQTGPTCEWYLEATPESDWISITGDGKGQGDGTASFSVSAGDVSTTGSLAPRDGVITLYQVATQLADWPDPTLYFYKTHPGNGYPLWTSAPPIGPDISMATLDINQLGEPANDDVPECSYNYAISQSVFEYPGGTAQLTVTASSQTCEWRINNWTVPGAWIHVSGCGQSCFGDQQLNVEVASGDQYSPPVPRSSTIIIDKKVGGTFEQMFAVPISQVR